MTKIVGESISSVIFRNISSGIFIMNQLGKHGFSCDFFHCGINMKDRKCFSDQMNRNHFDPILARCDWSCSTIENLKCLNFAVN